jgi:hypothetical protein
VEFLEGKHPTTEEFGAAREQLYRKVEADPDNPLRMTLGFFMVFHPLRIVWVIFRRLAEPVFIEVHRDCGPKFQDLARKVTPRRIDEPIAS